MAISATIMSSHYPLYTRRRLNKTLSSLFSLFQAKLKQGDDNGHGNKSYNSWLAWWRSTITTDDFLKFLSTQVTATLPLVFSPVLFLLFMLVCGFVAYS